MRSYKKITIFICILGLLLSMVTGCGEKQQETSGNAANEPTAIEYWHVNSENFGGPAIIDIVKEYNESQSQVTVSEKYNADMYKGLIQNLQAAIASGKTPAVAQIGYSFLNYVEENFEYVTPQDVVDKYFPEDKEFLKENFMPNVMTLAHTNDKQVGIPYSISNPVLYYNADLFEEARLDPGNPPSNWDEVREAARNIKDVTGNYGFFMQEYADNWAQQALMESNGGRMVEVKNGKTVATFASDDSAEAFQLLADMVLKDKTALHATNDEAFQAFLSGKLGMVVTTIGKRANFEKSANFELKATQFPNFKGKEKRIPAGGNFIVILAKEPEQQKAAWLFIKHMFEPKSLATWTMNTGYLPPRKGVAEDPDGLKDFIASNKIMQAAVSQLDSVVSWVSFPGKNGLQAEQVLIDTRDIILEGKLSAKDALQTAQEEINELLK